LFTSNWAIVFTGLVYSLLNIVLFTLIGFLLRGVLGLLGGIIMAIAMSAMISNYLYLLNNIVKHGKFTIQDFKDGFMAYIWKIYGVLFIGWMASFLFNMVIAPVLGSLLPLHIFSFITSLLILILLNALPESIYQKFYSSWETVLVLSKSNKTPL